MSDQPERQNDNPRAPPTQERRLEFLNFTGPWPRGNAETQRRIRSHVQAEYRRRNPAPQRRNLVVELSIEPLLENVGQAAPGTSSAVSLAQQRQSLLPNALPSPVTLLDASRSDPFAAFDIDRSRRSRQLWDHIYDGTCAKFRSLISIGFIDLVRETIAVTQMLSAAAWHLVHHLQCEEDRADDAKYSIATTQSLQRRLGNPAASTTDEVIVTVLTCAAYANLTHDIGSFHVHMDGLTQILHRKGGETSLDNSPVLRMALFWIETNGRVREDAAPKFPLPRHLLAAHSILTLPTSTGFDFTQENDLVSIEHSVVIANICHCIREVHAGIIARRTDRDFWLDVSFSVYNLSPTLHQLLSIPHGSVLDDIRIRQKECFRLAAIIYVTGLRAKFDPEAGTGMLYGSKLRMMVETPNILPSWNESNDFLIWVLTVGAAAVCLFDDLKSYFVSRLSECLKHNGVSTFEAFVDALNRVLWCDEAFGSELEALRSKLQLE